MRVLISALVGCGGLLLAGAAYWTSTLDGGFPRVYPAGGMWAGMWVLGVACFVGAAVAGAMPVAERAMARPWAVVLVLAGIFMTVVDVVGLVIVYRPPFHINSDVSRLPVNVLLVWIAVFVLGPTMLGVGIAGLAGAGESRTPRWPFVALVAPFALVAIAVVAVWVRRQIIREFGLY
jgi:hypothetical protein